MLVSLRLKRKEKRIPQIRFEFAYFSFLLTHLELKRSYTPVVPSKTIPDSRPKWAKCIPVFSPNGAKIPPDGAAHTYIAYIREYPPWIKSLTLVKQAPLKWNGLLVSMCM